MGRAVSNRARRCKKKWREPQLEEFLMTPEEVAQSAKVFSQQRKLEMAALPQPKPMPVFTDLNAYGEWRLPPGHENWVQDRIEAIKKTPFPEVFCPPLPRVQLNQVKIAPRFSPRPANGQIFKDVYPELIERAKAFLEPPEECEGAVGYDQRYYATPYLIKVVGRRRLPPQSVVFKGTSFLDARRCAQLVADDRKLQAAKARKMEKTKARMWMRKSHLLQAKPIVKGRKWRRANRKLHLKPIETKSGPKPEELLLRDFENLCLDSASGYSSDASNASLKEFLRVEKSLAKKDVRRID